MKYAAVLTLLVISGCAVKKPVAATAPGHIHYTNCHEVSVNYTTGQVTVICPLGEVKK
jgi:hypothetical protein